MTNKKSETSFKMPLIFLFTVVIAFSVKQAFKTNFLIGEAKHFGIFRSINGRGVKGAGFNA